MILPTKKLQNGFSMPVYGLGTWEMGGKSQRDPNNDDTADIKAIQTAIDMGITHIDTAEVYANGYTEELVGKAIEAYERKKLFLVSKVYSNHMQYDDLIISCKESLKRLKTDYLDLYLLHRYPGKYVADAMKALDFLVDEGLIRYIGFSNFTVEHMQEAQSLSKHKIVATQVHYNLQFREVEKKGVVDYCQKNDVMLIAWRPLQKGMILQENDLINHLMHKYKKTAAQIALNWLISQKNVVTLSKTRSILHLEENLEAIGWSMEDTDIELLRKEFPNQQFISDSVPLG